MGGGIKGFELGPFNRELPGTHETCECEFDGSVDVSGLKGSGRV
jgi:hypothetical protein